MRNIPEIIDTQIGGKGLQLEIYGATSHKIITKTNNKLDVICPGDQNIENIILWYHRGVKKGDLPLKVSVYEHEGRDFLSTHLLTLRYNTKKTYNFDKEIRDFNIVIEYNVGGVSFPHISD